MQSLNLRLHALLVFAFGFGFIYICYAGLPIDFSADYVQTSLHAFANVTIEDLISQTLNPLTPGWFYPPQGMMEYMRPLQVLPSVIFHQFAPHSLFPFHLAAALGMGLLSSLLFLVVVRWTHSVLYGWIAVALHTSFPSNFFIMASIGSFDFQFIVSVLTLTTLLLFYALASGKFKSSTTFFLMVLIWFLILWIDIKLKSSEKILPFVCATFLVLTLRTSLNRISGRRVGVLVCALLATVLLVVPFRPFNAWLKDSGQSSAQFVDQPASSKDQEALSFNFHNTIQRTFYVPGGDFPFSTVVRRKIARSVSENMGFFLSWFFWLGMLSVPFVFLVKRKRRSADESSVELTRFFSLICVWFAAIVAGFASGASVADLRFLNFAYIPVVLLLFLIARLFESSVFVTGHHRGLFRTALSVMVLFSIATNYGQLGKLIGHFGGMQDALVRAERDVFTEYYKQAPVGADLYLKHQELESRAVLVDWYEFPGDWLPRAVNQISQENLLFLYTRNEDSERARQLRNAGFQLELWRRYDFLDARPIFFRLIKQLDQIKTAIRGYSKTHEIVVYRVTKLTASLPG